MCARCDTEEYGKLLVYKFPKEKLIYGPRQIEARIDQQTEISSELTLWSQRGSEVFRGELLVIPIEKSIIYVEPVYLMASQDELPELKRVIVAFGDTVEMRHTLDEALRAVFLKEKDKSVAEKTPVSTITDTFVSPYPADTDSISELIRQANGFYKEAVRYQKSGDWAKYGENLANLQAVLERMAKLTPEKD